MHVIGPACNFFSQRSARWKPQRRDSERQPPLGSKPARPPSPTIASMSTKPPQVATQPGRICRTAAAPRGCTASSQPQTPSPRCCGTQPRGCQRHTCFQKDQNNQASSAPPSNERHIEVHFGDSTSLPGRTSRGRTRPKRTPHLRRAPQIWLEAGVNACVTVEVVAIAWREAAGVAAAAAAVPL